MVEQARKLNPGISFRVGNMMSLDLPDASLAGIAAFYAIVNIPKLSLPAVFREMQRVLQPGGLLLLAFHRGNEVLREEELWGQKISMDFLLFQPQEIKLYLETSGFTIDEIVERGPYPEVEYPSHRAYVFAARRQTAIKPQSIQTPDNFAQDQRKPTRETPRAPENTSAPRA